MDIQKLHSIFLSSTGACTDSRKIEFGQIFFALSGQNFNGNQFAKQALSNGASLAIIDDLNYKLSEKMVFVPDVLKCLQELGRFHRQFLGIPVIGITGSNGKTTTKELISNALNKKYKIAFTKGNLNNHIGVPLTLLSFSKDTEIGIVEMGANHEKEIENLCDMALPDFGIITNIGKAHLEGFGSYQGVIRAKSELYQHCRLNGKKVFVNGNDDLLMGLSNEIDRIIYGNDDSFQIRAAYVSADPFLSLRWKEYLIETQLVGAYNLNNVLAAITVGQYFNVDDNDIVAAISGYIPSNNRSQLTQTAENTLIIDAYNANPSSMELSIRNFVNIKNENKLLIIGDMFELGKTSMNEHLKIIDLVKELKFQMVYFVGKNFYMHNDDHKENFHFFPSTDELIHFLKQAKPKGYAVLLKASRGIQLEKVLDFL